MDPAFPNQITNVTGLAFLDDGRLVGSANGDALASCGGTCAVLVEIDPATGAGVLLGEIGDSSVVGEACRMPDLTFDPTTRTLYGYNDAFSCPTAAEGLWTVDPDGVEPLGTEVGASGFTGSSNGLARDPATGTLFATPVPDFVTLNPTTGAGTIVPGSAGNIPLEGVPALAFHPLTGVLYGCLDDNPDLVTINTADGVTTPVADITLNAVPLLGFDALVFQGPAGCTDAPLSCNDAARAKLSLKAKGGLLKLDLKKLGATTKAEFGNPLADTGYAVCLYDDAAGNATLIGGYAVQPGAGWKEQKKGFRISYQTGGSDGITSLKLAEGDAGQAKVSAKGKNVDLPDLPLTDDVTGQVVNDLGSCFGATVSAPKANQNTAERYNGQRK